jgi:histidyl-tRNA synthetase
MEDKKETEVKEEPKKDTEEQKPEEHKNKEKHKDKKEKKDKKKDKKEEKGGPKGDLKAKVKVVKGARDFLPFQMAIRDKAFKIITDVFKKHGAVEIDTPVFELKETLMGKYGEDSKLIYDLNDQGGELLSLRYDLTVPFARFMAVNNIPSIKRYHIGKVYRRDNPQMSRGRYREFYQCDFDIAGPNYGRMIPEADVIKVVVEILTQLPVGGFNIKLNHRLLLDAIVNISGIKDELYRTVCSSVDKLDKEEWDTVKKELIEKGITEEQSEKLWTFVQLKDKPKVLLEKLKANNELISNKKGKEALDDMGILFDYLEIMGTDKYCTFDLSLARGLDYYTGLIYETVLTDTDKVGSISGGGRYDNLVGMFSGKQIPAVGVSIGIERIFNILEEKYKDSSDIRSVATEVFVAVVGKNLTKERLKVLNELWDNGIKAEILYNENPRMDKQMDYVVNNKIPFMVFIGENELKENKIKIKCMANSNEIMIEREKLIEEIKKLKENPELLKVETKHK